MGEVMKDGKKSLIYAALIITSLLILFLTPLREWLTLSTLNSKLQHFQHLYNNSPILFVFSYILLYISTNTLFIPIGVLLNLAAGAIWGMPLGFLIALVSTTFGATSAYLFTRFMVKDFVLQMWGERIRKILKYVNHRNKMYLFILRLTPMFPYSLVNAAFAFTEIRPITFLGITFLGQILVIGILTNTGTELAKLHSLQDLWSLDLLVALFFFAVTPLVTTFLIKRFTRAK